MANLDDFKNRVQIYTETADSPSISHLFTQCNNTIFRQAPHMQAIAPPSTADIARRIKEICTNSIIYNLLEGSIQDQHQGYGVSKPVIFHYVSNMIIALLVYRRNNKTLSEDILLRLVSKLNIQQPILRAGMELLAEESLRRCGRPLIPTSLAV